jgi:hypothetical protein
MMGDDGCPVKHSANHAFSTDMFSTVGLVASRFAEALDTDDYPTAIALLASDCTYSIHDKTILGRDAIIEMYRMNSESARQRFDAVQYSSEVRELSLRDARICFTDHLRVGTHLHNFHCEQSIRLGQDGLISEIKHQELPGERQRLADFEAIRR